MKSQIIQPDAQIINWLIERVGITARMAERQRRWFIRHKAELGQALTPDAEDHLNTLAKIRDLSIEMDIQLGLIGITDDEVTEVRH